jgi:hypothetical protein
MTDEQIWETMLCAIDARKHRELWDHLRTGGHAVTGRDQELLFYSADGSGPHPAGDGS